MSSPLSFSSREELVSHLRSEHQQFDPWFKDLYAPDEVQRMVRESVGANTFRAFGGMPERPSVVFRTWANRRLAMPSFSRKLSELSEQRAYDQWFANFSGGLSKAWGQRMGPDRALSLGHSRKMANLLMKHVSRWSFFDEQERHRLIGFLHVPFDSFSLSMLRCCLPDPRYPKVGRIPSGASMGWIDSRSQYDELQALCRDVAGEARLAPIYLDMLAWNYAR